MCRRSSRSRRRAYLLAAVIAASAALLAACSGGGRPPAPPPSLGQQLDSPLTDTVLDAPLVSSTGQHVRLTAYTGKVVVVSDLMTLCQETCPLDTANVVAAARAVERAGLGDRVQFVSITIDPTRDDVARLAAYRRLYPSAPADWTLLTGTAPTIALLWKQLGVYIEKVPDDQPAPRDWLTGKPLTYDLTHSDELFFLDEHGNERFVLDGAPHVAPGAPIPPTLRKFLDEEGQTNLDHPAAQAWTLDQELQVISWLAGHRVTASSGAS